MARRLAHRHRLQRRAQGARRSAGVELALSSQVRRRQLHRLPLRHSSRCSCASIPTRSVESSAASLAPVSDWLEQLLSQARDKSSPGVGIGCVEARGLLELLAPGASFCWGPALQGSTAPSSSWSSTPARDRPRARTVGGTSTWRYNSSRPCREGPAESSASTAELAYRRVVVTIRGRFACLEDVFYIFLYSIFPSTHIPFFYIFY